MQIGTRLLDRDAGREPPDRAGISAVTMLLLGGNHGEGKPDVTPIREIESGLHHTDDRVRAAVDRYALADDRAIAREAPLPQALAQQGDVLTALSIFVGGEVAADHRVNAERREQVRGDPCPSNALGFVRLIRQRRAGPGPHPQR